MRKMGLAHSSARFTAIRGFNTMSKITLTSFALLLLLFLGNSSGNSAAQSNQKSAHAPAGTLQKMVVQSGSVRMQLDFSRLNATSFAGRTATIHFAIATNSFFPVLVFNDLLRGAEPGSMTLIPAGVNAVEAAVPAAPNSVSQATRLPLQLNSKAAGPSLVHRKALTRFPCL